MPSARGAERRNELLLVGAVGLILTVATAWLTIFPPTLLRYFNHRIYDTFLINTARPPAGDRPVLIGIDDRSLARYGQWPWPRYRLAQLVENLQRAGIQAIALDILMPEADRTSPEIIFRERARDLGEAAPLPAVVALPAGNDVVLSRALANAPSVLGYKFDFAGEEKLAMRQLVPIANAAVHVKAGGDDGWPVPKDALTSLSMFMSVARESGFTNAGADEDGILRRVPLLVRGEGGLYPSLGLAALLQASRDQSLRLTIAPDGVFVLWNGRRIPLDTQGNLLLNFRGQGSEYRYLSAAELLDGTIAAGALHGRIAIVGAWASGLGDRHVTPVDKSLPGMGIHALVIDNLLSGDFLQDPPWARGAELFFVISIGMATIFVLGLFGFLADLLLITVGATMVGGGAYALFSITGIYVSPASPLLLLFAGSGVLTLVKYGLGARRLFLRTCELSVAQNATIIGMTVLAGSRDEETGEHILRTQRYVEVLARKLSDHEKYRAELTEENIELLFKSAPLHDIGKVGIPDAILRKPESLTEEEYRIMKKHPEIGRNALADTKTLLRESGGLGYLHYACEVAISHHECWDGSGYPYGLKGDQIPLAGRLMAVADVYDALISARVYKPSYSHAIARERIQAASGVRFDPDVVAAFLAGEEEFIAIARQFADEHTMGAEPATLS